MADPYTIRIFVPYGEPDGLRIIDRMNWTGLGIAFPREDWSKIKQRSEFARAGVYILIGHGAEGTEEPEPGDGSGDDLDDDDLPTIYIGQGDVVRTRLEDHFINKDFWITAAVFVSNAAGGLNRAHATWLEHALIQRAILVDQSHLENGNEPQEPHLSEAERADTQAFMREMLQILPLIGLKCFEEPKTVAAPMTQSGPTSSWAPAGDEPDTIIVPAKQEGFDKVFLGENAWYAIRISAGKIPKIKYIAAYQAQPISAITYVAPVAKIEPYGDKGKYRLIFSEPAKRIGPIPFGDAPSGFMQGPRYTTYEKLQKAETVTDTAL
jgi:hypothetical protein